MADITRDLFDPVKAISRLLFQKRRPALDAEVNVIQENANYELQLLTLQLQAGSGAVQPGAFSPFTGNVEERVIGNNSGLFLADGVLHFVAGSDNRPFPTFDMLLNKVVLGAPPATGYRNDFVWLEIWEEQIDQNGTFYKWGNLLGSTVPNDIVDPGVGFPTSLRMVRRYEIRYAEDADNFSSVNVHSKSGNSFQSVPLKPDLFVDRLPEDEGPPHFGIPLVLVQRESGQTIISDGSITNLFSNVSLGSGAGAHHALTHSAGGTDEVDVKNLGDSEGRLPTQDQAQALPGAGGGFYPPTATNPYVSKDFADANYNTPGVDIRPMHVDEVVGHIDAVLPNRMARFVAIIPDLSLPNAVMLTNSYETEDYTVTALDEGNNYISISGDLPFPDNGKSVKVLLGILQIPHTTGFTVTGINEITFDAGLILEGDALQIIWPKFL